MGLADQPRHAGGIDYQSLPYWEQTWLTESTERLVGEDPVRLEVTTAIDGDEHTFTLDEGLDVLEREYHGRQANLCDQRDRHARTPLADACDSAAVTTIV